MGSLKLKYHVEIEYLAEKGQKDNKECQNSSFFLCDSFCVLDRGKVIFGINSGPIMVVSDSFFYLFNWLNILLAKLHFIPLIIIFFKIDRYK